MCRLNKIDLFDQYADGVRRWSAFVGGNPKIANKLSDQVEGYLSDLIKAERGVEILKIINDSDPGIRFMIAAHAERFDIDKKHPEYS